jgi:predicted RNase H-like HicB family nuclease
MNKDLDYYMALNYRIEVIKDAGGEGYTFRCPELPGCLSCADAIEEGMAMIEDAKREWFMACIEDNMLIPEPSKLDDYSGQFKLRIPRTLHRRLAERSQQEGISMNQYCLYLLSDGVK